MKLVVGFVPAQVQVDGAVGRSHGLLEQQQALQQRGLARRVAAQQHGDGRQLHRAAVAPGIEVLAMALVDHGGAILRGCAEV